MAQKSLKDFKKRSRTNVTNRVIKRIDENERRTKDMMSSKDVSSRSQVTSGLAFSGVSPTNTAKKKKPSKMN